MLPKRTINNNNTSNTANTDNIANNANTDNTANTNIKKDMEKQQDKPPQINNFNIGIVKPPELNASLLVKYDNATNKFTLFNKQNNLLGSITAVHIIKYITNHLSENFLQNYDTGISTSLINEYICEVSYENGKLKVNLKNHINSPFMGNIEMVMKLYTGIQKFIDEQLAIELNNIEISDKIKKSIVSTLNQLIYALLTHMLKLISSISEAIKNDPTKKELKNTLLKYSIGIVYKLSNLSKNDVLNRKNKINKIKEEFGKLAVIRNTFDKKLNQLTEMVEQNRKQIKSSESGYQTDKSENISSGITSSNVPTSGVSTSGVSTSGIITSSISKKQESESESLSSISDTDSQTETTTKNSSNKNASSNSINSLSSLVMKSREIKL